MNGFCYADYNFSTQNRTIKELGTMCYHLTRFSQEELTQFYILFFGSMLDDCYKFNGMNLKFEEIMLILLDYNSHGTPYCWMSHKYGGD